MVKNGIFEKNIAFPLFFYIRSSRKVEWVPWKLFLKKKYSCIFFPGIRENKIQIFLKSGEWVTNRFQEKIYGTFGSRINRYVLSKSTSQFFLWTSPFVHWVNDDQGFPVLCITSAFLVPKGSVAATDTWNN